MDWEFFGIVATLTSATVVLSMTYVVAQRIMADTKRRLLRPPPEGSPAQPPEDAVPPAEVLGALSRVEDRLSSLEARLDFTERLLEGPRSDASQPRTSDGGSESESGSRPSE